MKTWGCATCECRPGVHFACSSTATVTTGWRGNWTARRSATRNLDNAFTGMEDWAAAQELSDSWDPSFLHRKLDEFAQRFCPILQQFEESYHWSLDEAEYATDIVFRRQADLQAIYGQLIRTAIHTVKPDDIATFLGKKLNGNYQDEMGNRYNVRIEGTRVRHSMGMASIKMYDKFGQILRIETTVKEHLLFQALPRGRTTRRQIGMNVRADEENHLQPGPRCGNCCWPPTAATWNSSPPSTTTQHGTDKLNKITRTAEENGRTYRGFNFFDQDDEAFLASPAESSPSAACRIKRCASGSMTETAAKFHVLHEGFECTG